MSLFIYPPLQTTVTSGPLTIIRDGISTQVNLNTTDPAQIRPVPVLSVDGDGDPIASGSTGFGDATDGQRSASQIGNATGAADFNAGAVSAQTLRSVLEDQSRNALGSITDTLQDDPSLSGSIVALLKGLMSEQQSELYAKLIQDFGVSTSALRVASQIGNATGSADFNAGAVGAQTLRAVLENQSRNALGSIDDAAVINTALSGSVVSLLKGLIKEQQDELYAKLIQDFGISSEALRVASQIGNATGAADFNAGAVGAQTLRAVLEDQSRNAIGANDDAAQTNPASTSSIVAILKGLLTGINSIDASKSGTITSAVKTIGTTASRATVAGTAPDASRKKLIIKPTVGNTGNIFLGGSGVTTSNGLQIVGPDRLEFEMDSSDYYLISNEAAQSVEVLEVV